MASGVVDTVDKPGFEPIGDRLLVRPDELPSGEKVTDGGLLLVELGEEQRINVGTVVAVGDDVDYDIVTGVNKFSEGDRIVFSPWSGFEMMWGKTKYVLLATHEVLGYLREEGVDVVVG